MKHAKVRGRPKGSIKRDLHPETKRCSAPNHEGDRELSIDNFYFDKNRLRFKSWCKHCILDPGAKRYQRVFEREFPTDED